MSKAAEASAIADVQNSPDVRHIPIDKVGIKDIRHPVKVRDRSGGEQHTIATFNMYVNLPHDFKGTHMSRFVEILNNHEYEITVDSFKRMLSQMTERLEAEAGHIEMSFPYFINKRAPVSGVSSLIMVNSLKSSRSEPYIIAGSCTGIPGTEAMGYPCAQQRRIQRERGMQQPS